MCKQRSIPVSLRCFMFTRKLTESLHSAASHIRNLSCGEKDPWRKFCCIYWIELTALLLVVHPKDDTNSWSKEMSDLLESLLYIRVFGYLFIRREFVSRCCQRWWPKSFYTRISSSQYTIAWNSARYANLWWHQRTACARTNRFILSSRSSLRSIYSILRVI